MPGRLTRLSRLDTSGTRQAPRLRNPPRGLPPALADHLVYSAGTTTEAEHYGDDLLGRHRIRLDGDEADDFEATLHAVLVREVTLAYLDYHAAVTVHVEELPEHHLVLVPSTGTSTATVDERTYALSPIIAAVPPPGETVRLDINARMAHLVVRIERRALELHLSRLLGRSIDRPIRFEPVLDLSAPTASRWNFAVQMLHAELFEPGSLLHAGVGHGQIEEYLMSSLLYAHRSNYSDQLTQARAPRRAVRAARDFIDQNLGRVLTVADIADAAGVGVRTLQSQFAEDVGVSPTNYLRNARLDRVRADLADAPPGSTSVTEVASRWGFNHLGRFSLAYRQRFGEPPSQTLRS